MQQQNRPEFSVPQAGSATYYQSPATENEEKFQKYLAKTNRKAREKREQEQIKPREQQSQAKAKVPGKTMQIGPGSERSSEETRLSKGQKKKLLTKRRQLRQSQQMEEGEMNETLESQSLAVAEGNQVPEPQSNQAAKEKEVAVVGTSEQPTAATTPRGQNDMPEPKDHKGSETKKQKQEESK